MSTDSTFLTHPEFVDLDRHFAKFVAGFGGGELAVVAAAMLSRNMRLGHICLDLARGPAPFEEPAPLFRWPKLETWRTALAGDRAIGSPQQGPRPLVLDDAGRLYLRRYWEYEKALAEGILKRCEGKKPIGQGSGDMQELAIETALTRQFVVISGGPGTGKTTTVLKILDRMVSQPGGEKLRVALTAPTGKAAARLKETLHSGTENPALQERLPTTASTLHRLLASRPNSVYFKHNASNPLPIDLVVVDEASMVSLTMMAKLFDALPGGARVILLGDRNQLGSVEPGAILGDIALAASGPGRLEGSLVLLDKNYRFGNESHIFALSNAVRDGKVDRAIEILNSGEYEDLSSAQTPPPEQMAEQMRPRIVKGYSAYLRAADPMTALEEFKKFRVLCANRTGPYGVQSLNRMIENILREEELIRGQENSYPGLPIIVMRNDHSLRLYNGDIGILLPDPANGSLLAWFIGEEGTVRHIPPGRLPPYEPAFAMTVHKSQGSEFDRVLLILPDKESPLLTRELVYTGLTRARIRIELWYQESILRSAVARRSERSSGLTDRLSQRQKERQLFLNLDG